jgi:hypothetical protein
MACSSRKPYHQEGIARRLPKSPELPKMPELKPKIKTKTLKNAEERKKRRKNRRHRTYSGLGVGLSQLLRTLSPRPKLPVSSNLSVFSGIFFPQQLFHALGQAPGA